MLLTTTSGDGLALAKGAMPASLTLAVESSRTIEHMAYEEWQQESSPLKGVVVSYGDSTEDLYAQLHAKDLDRPAESDWWTPKLDITVNGADAAEVRGIAQEAIEKVEQGVVMPRIEVTDLQSGTPQPRASSRWPSPLSNSAAVRHRWPVGSSIIGGPSVSGPDSSSRS